MSKTKASRILVSHGMKTEIMAALGTTAPTVRLALSGNENTEMQRRIRAYALANGGVEAVERTETRWRKVDGRTWVQDTSAPLSDRTSAPLSDQKNNH